MDLESIRNFSFISTPISIFFLIVSIVAFSNGEIGGIIFLFGAILSALPLVSYLYQKKKLRMREDASVKYLSQQMQAMQTIVTVVRNFNRIFMLDITEDDIDEILSSSNAFATFEAKAKHSTVTPESFRQKMPQMLYLLSDDLNLTDDESELIYQVMEMSNEDITQETLDFIAESHSDDLPEEMAFLKGKINYEKACLSWLLGLNDVSSLAQCLPDLPKKVKALCVKKGYYAK